MLFTVIGLGVGPIVGASAYWLRTRGRRLAIGVAVLAGIGLGDSCNGLLRMAATTGWFYWAFIGVVALVLLVGVEVRRLRAPGDRVLAIVGSVAIAGCYVGVFSLL